MRSWSQESGERGAERGGGVRSGSSQSGDVNHRTGWVRSGCRAGFRRCVGRLRLGVKGGTVTRQPGPRGAGLARDRFGRFFRLALTRISRGGRLRGMSEQGEAG